MAGHAEKTFKMYPTVFPGDREAPRGYLSLSVMGESGYFLCVKRSNNEEEEKVLVAKCWLL